jgi:hypothetical protein
MTDRVVTAELPKVDRLVAGAVDEQAVDQVMVRPVSQHSLLAAFDRDPLKPPPGCVVEVEGVAM